MDTSILTFRLPDPGEGLTEAEIIRWLVAPGDQVLVNQAVVEIETAKSVVELPSPWSGTVESITAAEGAVVPVGAPILSIRPTEPAAGPVAVDGPGAADRQAKSHLEATAPAGVAPAPMAASQAGVTAAPAPADGGPGRANAAERTLVGYGPAGPPRPTQTTQPTEPTGPPQPTRPTQPTQATQPAQPAQPTRPVQPTRPTRPTQPTQATQATQPTRPTQRVKAKPPVRALARQLGIGLEAVQPTGPGHTVTRADVRAAAADRSGGQPSESAANPGPERGGRPDNLAQAHGEGARGDQAGPRTSRQPIRSVRRATAAAMVESAFSAPHASLFIETDATRGLGFARRTGLSLLALTAFALVRAAIRHPVINASWDQKAGEIVYHHYVNLGIAVDSPRGLLVPTVADADRLRLPELADGIGQLTKTARAGATAPEAMRGGTITLTNVGTLGVDGGSPILVPGQVAILALGAIRPRPWAHKGKIKLRSVGRLTLTFDHRLVDGADAAAAVKDIAAVLEWPDSALT